MNNHSLIERIKNNDGEQVLKEIYQQQRNEFLHWAVRNHDCTMEEAKEVFQQTMVILYENIVYGKVTEINVQMKTYIFGIGKNKLMEMMRRRNNMSVQIDEELMEATDIYYGVFDEIYESKLSQIEQCLRQIGDPCKTILQHYYYQKKSMQNIADLLDYKNSETVKNLKYKCLMRLKKIFLTSGEPLTSELS